MKTTRFALIACAVIGCFISAHAEDTWKPVSGVLMTQWGKQVTSANVWSDYPRPQLVRAQWQNLNGLWDFELTARDAAQPSSFDKRILVPFPVESALSGAARTVTGSDALWYRTSLKIRDRQPGKRALLNFEAVDFSATVWVNGREVGRHEGGYEPFSLDITDALGGAETADLVVKVIDATGNGQPCGKQRLNPADIWYTPSSGIWFTVWIEQVPSLHITQVNTTTLPDLGGLAVTVAAEGEGSVSAPVKIDVFEPSGKSVASGSGLVGQPVAIKISSPRLWSPQTPVLYDLKVTVGDDVVKSYAGLRKIEKRKDAQGINRFFLNNQPVFMSGVLDQGFWPDGLYTPPSKAAMRSDLEFLKAAGFNMLRKHIKVEPRVYYRACDELGLLVWQDMVSGEANERGKVLFKDGLVSTVNTLRNYPSIVTWVIFNEGWGQDADKSETRSAEMTELVRCLDSTRVINSVTGWHERWVGDVVDSHNYDALPGIKPVEPDRICVLGEFGGIGFPLAGHLWKNQALKLYTGAASSEDLLARYTAMYEHLFALKPNGLAASVYTQTSDVEGEVNGLLTYDRAVTKMPAEKLAALNRLVTTEGLKLRDILPTATPNHQATWSYTTEKPAADWTAPAFSTAGWQSGPAGFGAGLGENEKKGASVSTEWNTPDLWLRRTFSCDGAPLVKPRFKVFYDEDVEIYVNGKLLAQQPGYVTSYVYLTPVEPLVLKKGENVIAVHVHNTVGGQFIDVGIVDWPVR